ncbi:hypothetical protein GGI07_000067 [Coemansia sp. Benny D115]|nr:hypothetical protein GGI07_000067 [Coemansia sp. Benny D115]
MQRTAGAQSRTSYGESQPFHATRASRIHARGAADDQGAEYDLLGRSGPFANPVDKVPEDQFGEYARPRNFLNGQKPSWLSGVRDRKMAAVEDSQDKAIFGTPLVAYARPAGAVPRSTYAADNALDTNFHHQGLQAQQQRQQSRPDPSLRRSNVDMWNNNNEDPGTMYNGNDRQFVNKASGDYDYDDLGRPSRPAAGSSYGAGYTNPSSRIPAPSNPRGSLYAARNTGQTNGAISDNPFTDSYSKPTAANNYSTAGMHTTTSRFNHNANLQFMDDTEAEMDLVNDNSPQQLPPRPASSMGRYAARTHMITPRRLSFENLPDTNFGSNGAGTVKKAIPTPYTVRIKGPGAFPGTAQRFSQRKTAASLQDDMLSPTAARTGVRNTTNDLFNSHRYLNNGKATSMHRGWGEYNQRGTASAMGAQDAAASVRSFEDSFISNSTDSPDEPRDNPTLLRRLLYNITAGWTGSAISRPWFIFMILYFAVKEIVVRFIGLLLRLLVSSVRGSARSLVALIMVSLAAVFAIQHANPFSSGIGSLILSRLRRPASAKPVPLTPLTSVEITRLGGAEAALVSRLQQVEKTLSQLYKMLDQLKESHDGDVADSRGALERLQNERRELINNARGDKQRIDLLEREYAAVKSEIAKAANAAANARDLQTLKKQVDKLAKDAASEGGSGLFGRGAKGLSAAAVRKVVDDAIRAHEAEMRAMLSPSWLTSDGDAAYANVARMIDSALTRFANDRLAKTDFALYSAGARIIPKLTSETYEYRGRGIGTFILSFFGDVYSLPPSTILDSETHLGECWPMLGSNGQVAVRLDAPADIREFGLEHVAKSVAIDWRSAPRSVEVWGYVIPADGSKTDQSKVAAETVASLPVYADGGFSEQRTEFGGGCKGDDDVCNSGPDATPAAGSPETPVSLPTSSIKPGDIANPMFSSWKAGQPLAKLTRLATYEYEPSDTNPLQIIPVSPHVEGIRSDGSVRVQTIILKVNSNWGHPSNTCIYRLRAHGFKSLI